MTDEHESSRLHIGWRIWIITLIGAFVAGAATWWFVARYGAASMPRISWNALVLLGTIVALIPLTLLLRSGEGRDLLQKCLLFSLLVHVLLTMGFSAISVSREIIQYVREDRSMQVPIQLEASRTAELQLQVRNQITDLGAASPKLELSADPPNAGSIEVPIEAPRPLTVQPPRESATGTAPLKIDPPAPAAPVVESAVHQPLMLDSPAAKIESLQPRLSSPEPGAAEPPRGNLPVATTGGNPAPQIVVVTIPLVPPTGTKMIDLPLAPRGAPLVQNPYPAARPANSDPQIALLPFPAGPQFAADGQPAEPAAPAAQSGGRPSMEFGRPQIAGPTIPTQAGHIGSLLARPALATTLPAVGSTSPPSLPIGLASPDLPIALPARSAEGTSGEPAVALQQPPRPLSPRAVSDIAPRPGLPNSPSNEAAGTALPLPPPRPQEWASALNIPTGPTAQSPTATLSLPQSTATQIFQPRLGAEVNPKSLRTSAFSQRSEQARQPLVHQLGGSAETEAAVARALEYLARNQESDGRWSRYLSDRSPHRRRLEPHDVALTALCTLGFLASDHTPARPGPYQQHVRRAMDFLLFMQKSNGDLRGDAGADMYDHFIASIALAEAALMTGDGRYRAAALHAAEFTETSQNRRTGGWRYFPGEAADTSLTGWAVMALRSAEELGHQIEPQARADALRWLDSVSTGQQRILAAYKWDKNPTETMTAQAVLARLLLGRKLSAEQIEEASRFVTRIAPATEKNFYHWYYVSMMLMQVQNEAWTEWNAQLSPYLLKLQRQGGEAAGSWDPDGLRGDPGGRIYSTAMATLTLEVYYRYLPMYAMRGASDRR